MKKSCLWPGLNRRLLPLLSVKRSFHLSYKGKFSGEGRRIPPPGAGKEETEMEKRMGEMEWRHTRAMTVPKNHC